MLYFSHYSGINSIASTSKTSGQIGTSLCFCIYVSQWKTISMRINCTNTGCRIFFINFCYLLRGTKYIQENVSLRRFHVIISNFCWFDIKRKKSTKIRKKILKGIKIKIIAPVSRNVQHKCRDFNLNIIDRALFDVFNSLI